MNSNDSATADAVIAIDGPAGAGKSTVSKILAKKLGFTYLDTGAMYRALALAAARNDISADDEGACEHLAARVDIHFAEGEPQRVLLNNEDVTNEIRTPEIGNQASAISVHSGVRRIMVAKQQALVGKGGVVLEGRDATTVIAPSATLKVYLTASVEERARRRFLELNEKGQQVDLQDIMRGIEERDHRDMTRKDSPLSIAEGAHVLESDGLSPEQIVHLILSRLNLATKSQSSG